MKKTFLVCISIIILNTLLEAQSGSTTTLVGRWAAGPPYAFTVEDNIVYTASGGILQILDISNPSEPQLLGQISTSGIISDVAKEGNYVYLAEEDSGLKIIDVSSLNDPFQINEILLPGPVNKIIANSQTLFIAEGGYNGSQWTGGLRTLNISNPQNPQLLGFCDLPNESNYISLVDNYVYIDNIDNFFVGFFIINVSDLTNPTLVDTVNTRFGHSYLSGDFLFVASRSEGLKIFNISNPSSPTLISQTIISFVHDVTVNGNYAFLTCSDFSVPGRILSYDISDPYTPIELGFYDSPGNVASLSVNGKTLIINEGVYSSSSTSEEGCGLRLLDVTIPSSPHPISFYATPGWGESVTVRDNYAFVLTRFGGMSIVDLQNVSDPIQIGYYNSPGLPKQVVLQNNYAYLADGWRGVRVIDISDLTKPVEVGSFETGDFFTELDVQDNYAYVLFDGAMHILDVSNPSNISEVSFFEFQFTPLAVLVNENYAYLGDGIIDWHWRGMAGWIKIVDIANPSNPVLVGEYYDGGGPMDPVFYPTDFALQGNYLYVANEVGSLRVFEVSDPTNPVVISNTPTSAQSIEVEGNFAYILGNGLKFFDITDPYYPQLIDSYAPSFYTTDLDVKNGRIYTSAFDYGMMILQNDITTDIEEEIEIIPEEFTLNQNFPNPFNPSTKISYSLPSAGFVSLKIYDILGNEISTLVNENKIAGNYETIFNGEHLSSGVYLYVLKFDNQIYSKKMMLLK